MRKIKCNEKMKEKITANEELRRENEGLKEYSASRDESIKVYQQEIKDLEEKLERAEELTKGGWVKITHHQEMIQFYQQRAEKAEARVKRIDDTLNTLSNHGAITDHVLNAIKTCAGGEGMKGHPIASQLQVRELHDLAAKTYDLT